VQESPSGDFPNTTASVPLLEQTRPARVSARMASSTAGILAVMTVTNLGSGSTRRLRGHVPSRCLLEQAGLATGEGVLQVNLDGSWQMLSACRLGAGCVSKASIDCGQECQPERVFVPTAVSGQ
jgi:hypothetical protein